MQQYNKKLTYCDYCHYYNKNSRECLARPNSTYCTAARQEFFQNINNKNQQPVKSFRKWYKR